MVETETPFELVEIDLSVPRESWYLEQVNPVGKVPAIKLSDGQIICESSVCAEYIADLTGKLLPKDPIHRSHIRFFIETFISKFPIAVYSIYSSDDSRQTELLKTAVASVNSLLEKYLCGGPFLLGSPSYTLAEVDCVPFLARFKMAGTNGLYPTGVYEEITKDKKYALFNQYLEDCLSWPSHREIWDEEANLRGARKRVADVKKSKKTDYIFLENLQLNGKVGLSAFSFPDKSFPLSISIKIKTEPVEDNSDAYSISYGDVCREITAITDKGTFARLEDLSAAIILARSVKDAWQSLQVQKKGGMLRAENEMFEIFPDGRARSSITGIRLGCIIGVYPHEREKKQDVVINLTMLRGNWAADRGRLGNAIEVEDYKRTMIDAMSVYVEKSSFKTVEALAQAICSLSLSVLPGSVEAIEVRVSKPSALVFAEHAGVCVTRTRKEEVMSGL